MQQHVRVDAAAAVAGGAVHDGGEEGVVAAAAAAVAAVVVEVREGGHAIVDLVEVVLDIIVVDLKGFLVEAKTRTEKGASKADAKKTKVKNVDRDVIGV